jgi:hypothetical protein
MELNMRRAFLFAPIVALALGGCIVTTTAGLLFNGAKLAGKTVYYTGKGVHHPNGRCDRRSCSHNARD